MTLSYLKTSVFVRLHEKPEFYAGYVWTVGHTGEKISAFKNKNGYIWTGPTGDVTRDNTQRRF